MPRVSSARKNRASLATNATSTLGVLIPKWDRNSRQLDRLKRADDVVRTLVLEKALVKTWTEVPVIAFVIFVTIKPPDAAHDDETTDPVVPKIAEVMETEICPREGAFETNVIVDDQLGQTRITYRVRFPGLARTGVITQRTNLPFRVDDTAIVWRQLGFRYLSHKGSGPSI